MAHRSVSVPMTLSDLDRDASGQIFQTKLEWLGYQMVKADLLNNARTVWPRTTKFGRITCGEERISRGSTTPLLQGRCQHFPILGVLFHLCIHPLSQN